MATGNSVQVSDVRSDAWQRPVSHPELRTGVTHVWRIRLAEDVPTAELLSVLSHDEQDRVRRFYFPHHGRRYATAHSALRQILAAYELLDPRSLTFVAGEHGKPAFAPDGVPHADNLHFNLSHSGDVALVAVSRDGAVGVDVERWRTTVQHLEIAERFFSPTECEALRSLEGTQATLRGFFSTWSRKEAYLKATGHGIARGLHHFDVTMDAEFDPGVAAAPHPSRVLPARLLADRLDPQATARWDMTHLDVGPGYSGALVSTRPDHGVPGAVALFESPYI